MHAVMRKYSGEGAKEFYDLLEKRKSDVEQLMRSVKGFVSYALVRTDDGGFSISVFQDKAGADESSKKAREWTAKNAGNLGLSPPALTEGTVVLQLK
jgi:hypothetical protein